MWTQNSIVLCEPTKIDHQILAYNIMCQKNLIHYNNSYPIVCINLGHYLLHQILGTHIKFHTNKLDHYLMIEGGTEQPCDTVYKKG